MIYNRPFYIILLLKKMNTYIVDLSILKCSSRITYTDEDYYYKMTFSYGRLVGLNFYSRIHCMIKLQKIIRFSQKPTTNISQEFLDIMEETITSLDHNTFDLSKEYNFVVITNDDEKTFGERIVSKFISNLKKEGFEFEVEQM